VFVTLIVTIGKEISFDFKSFFAVLFVALAMSLTIGGYSIDIVRDRERSTKFMLQISGLSKVACTHSMSC
jgi:hypothetical protein